ncbi:MAG: hypothetical protein AAF533_14200 [Acidobacteriota bacterium]
MSIKNGSTTMTRPIPATWPCLVVSILLLTASTVSAGEASMVQVGFGTGEAGEGIVIELSLAELHDECLAGFQLDLELPDDVSFVSALARSEACITVGRMTSPTMVRVGVACTDGMTVDEIVAELILELPPDATMDLYMLTPTNVSAADCDGRPLLAEGQAGQLAVAQDCGLLGDIYPDLVGDGVVDLRDLVLARRKGVDGSVPVNLRDFICGDLDPAPQTCRRSDRVAHHCPSGGDGSIGLDDAVLLRQVLAGRAVLTCDPCLAGIPGLGDVLRLPGDVAPRGEADGEVDVADVVLLLRWSVGLESAPIGEEALRGDLAPAFDQDGRRIVVGNEGIDIGDVVEALRASVGLQTLAWPKRRLALRVDDPASMVAYRAAFEGWPAWAELEDPTLVGCLDGDVGGLDEIDGVLTVTCLTDPDPVLDGAGDLLLLDYRGPEALSPDALALDVEAVNDQLTPVTPVVATEDRGEVER